MCRLSRFFRRRAKEEPREGEEKIEVAPKRRARAMPLWKSRRIFRVVSTSRGGPNMPKSQPCPQCGKWGQRDRKTMGGAYYRCSRCKSTFFVRAAREGQL